MAITPEAGAGGGGANLGKCTEAPVKGDGTAGNPQTAGVIGIGEVCPGVSGSSQGGVGVAGSSQGGIGVAGVSMSNSGVDGQSATGFGVSGTCVTGKSAGVAGAGIQEGVLGRGRNGVHGISTSKTDSGVWGENKGGGYGVSGSTTSDFQSGPGVTAGVWGNNAGSGAGVKGSSIGGDGVIGFSSANGHAGVWAVNHSGGDKSYGLWAEGIPAGHFEGTLEVNGDASVTGTLNVVQDIVLSGPAMDCAEDFHVAEKHRAEPGTVMVLDDSGALRPSEKSYDRKVVGVISGAGDYRPGMILGRCESSDLRVPIALIGRVYCRADAECAPIEAGDLLTTSPTPGHAMKATDPLRAFGAVIGKALCPLSHGQGLVPILVCLQ